MKALARRSFLIIMSAGLLSLGSGMAVAGDIPWSSLSTDEQQTLSRARDKWDQLSTERQQRLLDGAHRWQNMSPEQREQARDRWRQRREEKRQHNGRD